MRCVPTRDACLSWGLCKQTPSCLCRAAGFQQLRLRAVTFLCRCRSNESLKQAGMNNYFSRCNNTLGASSVRDTSLGCAIVCSYDGSAQSATESCNLEELARHGSFYVWRRAKIHMRLSRFSEMQAVLSRKYFYLNQCANISEINGFHQMGRISQRAGFPNCVAMHRAAVGKRSTSSAWNLQKEFR